MFYCWRQKCQRGGTVVGGWHWLAAGGQRRTSRTHHHPCCGVLCINRLEVAEQGLCDTFGHNIYLIKLLLLPSLPDLDNNDGDWANVAWMTGESLDFPSPPLANIFGITIKEMRNNNETRRTEVLSTMNEGSWMMSLLSVCLSRLTAPLSSSHVSVCSFCKRRRKIMMSTYCDKWFN